MSTFARLTASQAPRAVVLIRLMIGLVFLSEGIQKFMFPDDIGAGRFARIGLPLPEVLGPFVGSMEIVCGVLVLLGFASRVAALPLLIIMAVAVWSTKLPILLQSGFWKMAHDSRNDFAMICGSLFLLIVGSGAWSLDRWFYRRFITHAGGKD